MKTLFVTVLGLSILALATTAGAQLAPPRSFIGPPILIKDNWSFDTTQRQNIVIKAEDVEVMSGNHVEICFVLLQGGGLYPALSRGLPNMPVSFFIAGDPDPETGFVAGQQLATVFTDAQGYGAYHLQTEPVFEPQTIMIAIRYSTFFRHYTKVVNVTILP